jgi:hypothetical protein
MGEIVNLYRVLVEKSEGKRPLRIPNADGSIILKQTLMI